MPYILPASGSVSALADTFNRASGRLGTNWLSGTQPSTPVSNPIEAARPWISLSSVDGLPCMSWVTITTGNPLSVWYSHLIAVPLIGLNGKSQFSQWKMLRNDASAGNAVAGGPSVLHTASGIVDCYMLTAYNDKSWALYRRNDATFANLANAAAGTLVNGDDLYLQAMINTGNVTLIAKRNGIVIATVVDSSGSRLSVGSPGFQMADMGGTGGQTYQSEWRNFSGGKL